ncbi:MAG: hypothetical protein ABIT10_12915 [Alteraurantiacibacter sp.]
MTHPDQTPAAQSANSGANLPAIRHDGWTPARQAAFLNQLSATHCVATAAQCVGMSRQSAYALRARLKGEPFDRAWAAALVCRFDALAEAALDRALNGVEVPHFYKGEVIATSRKFDERLTVALLAMRGIVGSAPPGPQHPSAQFRADDFGRLVDRVAQGPETWDEEWRIGYAQALEECELPDEEDWDEEGDAK